MDDFGFFDAFFNDTPNRGCADCGSEESLLPLGSATGGAQMWICKTCKAKRDEEARERVANAKASSDAWTARDEWEE